jgi:hypothetical protein
MRTPKDLKLWEVDNITILMRMVTLLKSIGWI